MYRFGQSYESRSGASVGKDKKMFNIRRRKISACFEYTNTTLLNISFSLRQTDRQTDGRTERGKDKGGDKENSNSNYLQGLYLF